MNLSNAEGGTRTPTSLRTLRPERSAYTNFTTSASSIAHQFNCIIEPAQECFNPVPVSLIPSYLSYH